MSCSIGVVVVVAGPNRKGRGIVGVIAERIVRRTSARVGGGYFAAHQIMYHGLGAVAYE